MTVMSTAGCGGGGGGVEGLGGSGWGGWGLGAAAGAAACRKGITNQYGDSRCMIGLNSVPAGIGRILGKSTYSGCRLLRWASR